MFSELSKIIQKVLDASSISEGKYKTDHQLGPERFGFQFGVGFQILPVVFLDCRRQGLIYIVFCYTFNA